MIDPDLYFARWIVEKSSSGKLQRETAGSKTLKSTLLQAVEFGWNLIVDRIEIHVEPILLQAAAKHVQQRGMSTIIHLGGKDIEYNPRFRLFLGQSAQTYSCLPCYYLFMCLQMCRCLTIHSKPLFTYPLI